MMGFLFERSALGPLLVALAAGAAALVFLHASRRFARRRAAAASGGREPAEATVRRQATERLHVAANELQAELQSRLRQARARIEAKLTDLDRLIEDADQKIAELEAILEGTRQQVASVAPEKRRAGEARPLRRVDPPHRASRHHGSRADLAGHRWIYTLADQGWPVAQIARFTGTTPREIEEILARRRGAA